MASLSSRGRRRRCTAAPATLFAAEFMGSNNRLHGKVMALENGGADRRRQLEPVGASGRGVSVGEPATAVIRVERLRLTAPRRIIASSYRC